LSKSFLYINLNFSYKVFTPFPHTI
jgi:hypothetical protein